MAAKKAKKAKATRTKSPRKPAAKPAAKKSARPARKSAAKGAKKVVAKSAAKVAKSTRKVAKKIAKKAVKVVKKAVQKGEKAAKKGVARRPAPKAPVKLVVTGKAKPARPATGAESTPAQRAETVARAKPAAKAAGPVAVPAPAPAFVAAPPAPAPAAAPIKTFPAAPSPEGARSAPKPVVKAAPARRGGRETQRVGEGREAIPPAGRSAFSPAFLASQRVKLLAKKEEILAMYKKDLQSGQESNDSPTEDIVDRANNAYSRELAFSISDNERELMLQIDQAIARLDAGSYGYCMHTGQPIGIARLEALPWAKYGVEAQEMLEKGLLSEA